MARSAALVLGATRNDVQRPLRLFTPGGRPIGDHDGAWDSSAVVHVLLENDVWVWPGIRVGMRWFVCGVELETLSLAPRVILVRNVTTPADARALIANGRSTMKRSSEKHYSPGFENYRTSKTGSLSPQHGAAQRVQNFSQQIARVSSLMYVEPPQLLLYRPPPEEGAFGDWYKGHHDLFHNYKPSTNKKLWAERWVEKALQQMSLLEPKRPARTPPEQWSMIGKAHRVELAVCETLLRSSSSDFSDQIGAWIAENLARASTDLLQALLNHWPDLLPAAQRAWTEATGDVVPDEEPRFVQPNRHATMLFYLNDVQGGETAFPRASPANLRVVRRGVPECSQGLVVPPVAFGAALFYNKHGNGTNDFSSYHAGCPTVSGEKWAINSWIWNVPWQEGVLHFN